MILVFGSINLDLIFALDGLPVPGRTVLGPGVRMEPGGKGANQACAAARDGARVVMAGAVGRDALAEGALPALEAAGVDLTRVARVEAATGCAAICVDREGRNQIAVGSGANLEVREAQVEDALLGPATTLVLQMEVDAEETARLIRRAHARGARIVLNLAPAHPLPAEVLRQVDVLVVNEDEAATLGAALGCEAAAAPLHGRLGVAVVVTLGGEGAEAASPEGVLRVAGCPVAVRDTTGAGDCFTGVLAASLDRGEALADAMRRANLAAALACTRIGAQAALPLREEIDAALPRSPRPG
jgi:ribokinase